MVVKSSGAKAIHYDPKYEHFKRKINAAPRTTIFLAVNIFKSTVFHITILNISNIASWLILKVCRKTKNHHFKFYSFLTVTKLAIILSP